MKTLKALLAFIAVAIAGLVIFAYLGHRETLDISKNETAAYLFLRAVSDDNHKLKSQTGACANSLERLNSLKQAESKRARSAYEFRYHADGDSFAINADPKEYGKTGIRSFYIDQTGIVRYEAGKPAGAASAPVSSAPSTTTTR